MHDSSARRILVVDDNLDVAKSFASVLSIMGYEVQAVHDGMAALATARSFQPEVVFVDIGLPRMDGYEVARRLREEHPDGRMLLVAVTGYGKDEAPDNPAQPIFDHHLLKPVDFDLLETLLKPANA